MLAKKITKMFLAIIMLYSAETNAAVIKGNDCTLGVLPLGSSMVLTDKRDEILSAFEAKGFFATELKSPKDMENFEFIADGSVDCNPTYFGIFAETTVRIVETSSNKIVSRVSTPGVMDMFACKIELLKAIAALPACSIK